MDDTESKWAALDGMQSLIDDKQSSGTKSFDNCGKCSDGENRSLLTNDDSNNSFTGKIDNLINDYHSDLISIFLASVLSVFFFMLIIEYLGRKGLVQEGMISLVSSIISAVIITSIFYINRVPVIF